MALIILAAKNVNTMRGTYPIESNKTNCNCVAQLYNFFDLLLDFEHFCSYRLLTVFSIHYCLHVKLEILCLIFCCLHLLACMSSFNRC